MAMPELCKFMYILIFLCERRSTERPESTGTHNQLCAAVNHVPGYPSRRVNRAPPFVYP